MPDPATTYRPVRLEVEVEPGHHGPPTSGTNVRNLLQVPRAIAAPAVGVDFTIALEGGYMWRLLSLSALLTASPAVAQRIPSLQFQDGDGNVYGQFPVQPAVVAGQAVQVTWAVGGGGLTAPGGAPGSIGGVPNTAVWASASSGNVANAIASATIAAGGAGVTSFLTGFEMTAGGATAATTVIAQLTGLQGGTRYFTFGFPAGATASATPLIAEYPEPLPASAANTAITLTLPAGGLGNLSASVNLNGFQLPAASAGGLGAPIPERWLQGGWKIAASTLGLQGGDQWSKIFALFERVGGQLGRGPELHG